MTERQFQTIRWAVLLAVLSSFVLIWGCDPPPPPPVDCRTTGCEAGYICTEYEPDKWGCRTPQPAPEYVEMLLRADGSSAFVTIDGLPVEFRGAISCCSPNDWGGVSGWPVNFAPDWQDWTDQYKINFFHGRLGPFLKGGTAFPEPWGEVGGPYLTVSGEKVDLDQWNQRYWSTIKDWVRYAGDRGKYVEIDIIDGWYCKHGQWGDVKMPWMEEYNVQGLDLVEQCGRQGIQAGDRFDRWVEKVVTELGPLGNVIWQDGNEVGLIQGYSTAWSLSMKDRVRYWENEVAFGVVHMFGTNSKRAEVETRVDYIESHRKTPHPAPVVGRPSLVNEYNPNPAFTPQQMNEKRCAAEKGGTFWWYWRHTQTLEEMRETLRLFLEPCPTGPPPGCEPTPQAGVYWLYGQTSGNKKTCIGGNCVADFTPKQCAFCFCEQFNHCMAPNRRCCPVACEGDPTRLEKERELMGGDAPVWTLTVRSGDLRLSPDPWKGVVRGSGEGTLKGCFPNGKACNTLEIDK